MLAAHGGCGLAVAADVRYTEVMAAGEGGVYGFRIPGFLTTNRSLHVFAEARQYSCSDTSMHSMVYKRSTDGGASFSELRTVVDPPKVWGPQEGGHKGGAVYDPTPVYDEATKTIWVLFSYCPSRYMARPAVPWAFEMWAIKSTDDGLSFSIPRNLSGVYTPGGARWCQRTAGAALDVKVILTTLCIFH